MYVSIDESKKNTTNRVNVPSEIRVPASVFTKRETNNIRVQNVTGITKADNSLGGRCTIIFPRVPGRFRA